MRRDEMLIKRIRECRASGMHDDPDVIAVCDAPSWVRTAVIEGWAEERPGEIPVWRLTPEGKAAVDAVRPVGRPRISHADRAEKDAQKAVETLKIGLALHGPEWLDRVIKEVRRG